MNNMESAAQFLGIPSGIKKKPAIRRGGGRHKPALPVAGTPAKPASVPGAPKTPAQHFTALQGHMKSGNTAAAKSSSLMLAKALHQQTGSVKKVPPAGGTSVPATSPMSDPSLDGM